MKNISIVFKDEKHENRNRELETNTVNRRVLCERLGENGKAAFERFLRERLNFRLPFPISTDPRRRELAVAIPFFAYLYRLDETLGGPQERGWMICTEKVLMLVRSKFRRSNAAHPALFKDGGYGFSKGGNTA
jgi:hypothetical protein